MLTRWNTWFHSIEYLSEFLPHILDFVKDEKDNQERSELINSLYDLLEDSYKYSELKLLVHFYVENAQVFHDLILKLEDSLGNTHITFNIVRNLWNLLRFQSFSLDFGENINNIMIQGNMDQQYWNYEFKNLYKKAWTKLDTMNV